MRKKLFLLGLVLSIIMLSGPASAIVTDWDYDISALFTAATFSDGTSIISDTDSLYWGVSTGAGQSSLSIGAAVSGSVDTILAQPPIDPNDYFSDWATGISLTHDNNPIYAPTLLEATFETTVTLDPTSPDNDALDPFEFSFDIKFKETPNTGSNYDNKDIFALIGGFPNFDFSYDDETGYGSQDYYVNVFPSDGTVLGLLTQAQTEALGETYDQYNPLIGFTTFENQSTTLPFAFTISTAPFDTPPPPVVPEPATLLLLGFGLLGLGIFSRRRRGSKM